MAEMTTRVDEDSLGEGFDVELMKFLEHIVSSFKLYVEEVCMQRS